jgi:LemA protein
MALSSCAALAQMSGGMIALAVAGGVVLLVILWYFAAHNGLVGMRMAVKNAWAQIDVQLKRRHDLIPNLVEACRGYMGFEKEVLENVVRARSEAMKVSGQGASAQGAAEAALSQAMSRLYVVVENYPELRSSANVSKLMDELSGTESRIAYARQHYNDRVMDYNTAIQQVPRNIVASMGGFTPEAFFEIQAADREVPKVNLGFGT